MFSVKWSEQARRQLGKLARRNPEIAQDIYEKAQWLANNAEKIGHERLVGRGEMSLHSGQYRIPYSLDWANQVVIIQDIDKHDAAYRKLNRR